MQQSDPYASNASRIEGQRKNQIDGKYEEEEDYNEDSAWGDVKKAKRDVIDSANHVREYDTRPPPRVYGIKRDTYGDDFKDKDRRSNYNSYTDQYGRDRKQNCYGGSREKENRYG